MTSDFARSLAFLRHERKITQSVASSALGVSQVLLSHYEKGRRRPNLNFVVKAADYYGVSCDFLLGRSISKDGSAVSAQNMPDISKEKDNVLRGNIIAMLHKKLIVNSSALIFELVGKTDSDQVIEEISNYLSLAIYRVFRYLYSSGDDSDQTLFKCPINHFEALCDSEAKLCELRIKSACLGTGEFNLEKEEIVMPDLSPAAIAEEFPGISQSLLSLLQTVTTTLSKYENG